MNRMKTQLAADVLWGPFPPWWIWSGCLLCLFVYPLCMCFISRWWWCSAAAYLSFVCKLISPAGADKAAWLIQIWPLFPFQEAKLRHELALVKGNLRVMSEMLNELVPGQSQKDDAQLLQVCPQGSLYSPRWGESGFFSHQSNRARQQHNNK